MTNTIYVLHVDDDPSFGDLVATFLEREDDRFAVKTVTSAAEGLDTIRDRPPDCIVSDYDMPGQNGIEFLQSVHDEWLDIPFILFTGKGSEEVASDAISNGATDYLQKGSGTDQYELLANRIGNAVEQDRSTRRAANLERVRQLTYDVNQAMVRATSAEEIERQVCQLITDSDPYVTVCIANVNRETMEIEPRTWGGDAAGYFKELDMIIDEGSPGRHAPGGRAFHDREIAVSQNIEEDGQYARWRESALQRGFRSLAVVPIEYEDELHGLLATFASRPNAFDQTEQKLLNELADDIGHALHGQYLQAERRELVRQRERAETVFEHTQDALFLIDVGSDRTFTIRSVNRAYEELTGYSLADLKGRTPRELLGDDQGAEVEANFEECVEKREPIEYDEQLTFGEMTKDWHTRLVPVVEDDRVVQLVGATRDITDQRERQRRYEAIFNQTYQFTGLLEPDGTLIEANETALAFGGLDPDDVLGKKVWEAYWFQHSEKTRDRAREAVERAADGEFVRHELPVQGTDREAIIDFSVRPLIDEQGEVSLLIPEGRDITKRKQREQKLKEESERFRAIFEKSFDAMVIADDEGTFINANESATELFDLPTEELLGRSIKEFAPEDFDFETIWREFQELNRDRSTFSFAHPEGTERVVEYTATRNIIPGQHLSVLRDVTDRKDREARLEALNETAQELMTASKQVEVAEIGVSAARDVLGLTVSGIHLYDDAQEGLVPVAQTEESRNLVGEAPTFTEGDSIAWRVYESGEPRALDDVQDDPNVYNPDTPVRGEIYFPIGDYGVLLNASETPEAFDREDIVLGELLAGTVATALEQIERTERLHTRERDLERQNERLEEFASVVSHDLRNPLNVARGRIELLREESDSEHIDPINRSLSRMEELIEDLLTLARQGDEVSNPKPTDLRDLSESCWANVATSDAALQVTTTRSICADQSQVQQLLENLFRNAVEHGGDDVTITVGELDGGFYVEDDGPGIPEDERDDVFNAGYSTAEDGTGFGLSIVKQVVNAHGWDIRVTGGSDGGARFETTGLDFAE